MKIDKPVEIQPTQDAALRAGQPAGAARPAARAGAQGRAGGAADSVSLSAASRGLAAELATDGAEVRHDKVAQVREAIREGRFNVKAQVVADKMIAQAAELLETLTVPKR